MTLRPHQLNPFRELALCGKVCCSFVALAYLFLLIGCTVRTADKPKNKSANPVALRIGVPALTGQDPLRGLQQASRLLNSEGLAGNTPDGRAIPRLAKSWTVSPDGLQWTFMLRPDAKFHDGSAVDAVSVKRSIDESLASLTDRSLFPGLEDITKIEAANSHQLVITLRHPSTFLIGDLSMPISKLGTNGSTLGTGPFVTTDTSGNEIVMRRFDDYYQGAPTIEQVVWKPYPAVRTAWAGLMRDEIDFLYEVGQETVQFVQGESSVNLFSFLRPYVLGVVFNSGRGILKNTQVRKALNFAVDRNSIVKAGLGGRGLVAETAVRPTHWAYDPNVAGYTYDSARAAAILDSLGLVSSRTRDSRFGSPARLHFTCLLIDNLALWERMALLVQRQLFEIGVDMKLEAVPADEFDQRLAKGDFEAAFLEFSGFSMSRPYVFWHSMSSRNSFGYKDTAVDEALDAIRRASDDTAYRAAVSRLQTSMVSNPPGIFLAWGQTIRAVSRRFLVTAPADSDILSSVSSWDLTGNTAQASH